MNAGHLKMKTSTTNTLSVYNLSMSSLKPSLDSLFDSVEDLILVPLDGDASARRYYRLLFRFLSFKYKALKTYHF